MFLSLLACVSSPPPTGGPAILTTSDGALVLDGAEVLRLDALAADPTTELDDDLVAALRPAAGREIAVVLAPETPVWIARKVVGSAREAGVVPSAIGAIGATERFPLADAPRYGLETACEAPRAVRSTEPLVTLSIQNGADGAWVLATAQFLPTFGPSPGDAVDGLPPTCVAVPGCDVLYATDATLRAACEEGGGDHRVALGGAHGCLLPIARKPDDVSLWRAELPAVVASLDLGSRPLLLVMPEARVRLDAVLAVLGGFRDAGVNVPPLGLSLLVEGNDGPPPCDAQVRDAAALTAAGARWLGGMRRAVTALTGSPPPR
jgi:hypothetical protein